MQIKGTTDLACQLPFSGDLSPECLRSRSEENKVTKMIMSHTTTEEKCGMDFSPSSGEATSWEKKFPMSHEWLATSDK